jgi:hypothetical protein
LFNQLHGVTHLCGLGSQAEQIVIRPPAAAETRWAGLLPQIPWMNEFSSVLQMYTKNPAQNCVAYVNEDVYVRGAGTPYMSGQSCPSSMVHYVQFVRL